MNSILRNEISAQEGTVVLRNILLERANIHHPQVRDECVVSNCKCQMVLVWYAGPNKTKFAKRLPYCSLMDIRCPYLKDFIRTKGCPYLIRFLRGNVDLPE